MQVKNKNPQKQRFLPQNNGGAQRYVKPGHNIADLQKSLRKGQAHAQNGEWAGAVKHLLKAWEAMPEDLAILTILSHALVQLGVREQAIYVLERALEVHEPNEELIGIILRLAIEMGMYDIGVKLGQQLILLDPGNPTAYVNLATAYSGAKQYDESISMLQQAIPLFPANADLWNVLATQVRERDGVDAADIFFEEALKLRPNDPKILSNYSISFTRRNQIDRALEVSLQSIKADPDLAEPRIGAAQFLFLKGRLSEAWEHYEFRLDSRRKSNQTQHYTHKLPLWQGEALTGKSLFVTAEQGIGDEVMWGSYLPFLYEQAEKLYIGCDPRLVSIYTRRFPDACVASFSDKIVSGYRYRSFVGVENLMKNGEANIDYYVPVASGPRHVWLRPEDVQPHPEGFLSADPQRLGGFKSRFADIGNKPKVGIAWRSGIVSSERAYLYASIEALAPLMELRDKVDFINLQYGEVSDEVAAFKDKYNVTIHTFDDVNLKQDIEANMAIASNCDLVVSSCSAPGMFSMSVGVPTLFMAGAKPWWCFGQENRVPFATNAELFSCRSENEWEKVVQEIADRTQELIKA